MAAVVEAGLSLLAADEDEATEEEIAVDVAVLVAEAVFGVVEATDVAARAAICAPRDCICISI